MQGATLPATLIPPTLEVDDGGGATSPSSKPESLNYTLVSISDIISPEAARVTFTPATDVLIGREPTCQLSFPDCQQISRLHCKIFSMGRDVFVMDTSSNGTYVNGALVGKGNRRLVRDGDLIAAINPKLPESLRYTWRFLHPVEQSGPRAGDAKDDQLHQHYEVGKVLGTGNFATVRLGTKRLTGERVAIKIIEKKRFALSQDNFSFNSLLAEVEILRKMDHPNIIRIYDVFDDPRSFTMVLELVPNGDFFDYIVGRCPQPFTEAEARALFVQLLEAMLYMHSKNVVHRDLKPENILAFVNPSYRIPMRSDDHQQNARQIPVDQVTLKITDFGLAKFCGEHEVMTTMCGTPSYLAPEVQCPPPNSTGGYSWSVDVWSLGVILYIVLSGCPPKDPQTGNLAFNRYFETVSESAKDLIKRMLRVNPRERADLAEICNHPWLRDTPIKLRHLAVPHERLMLSGTVMLAPAATVSANSFTEAMASGRSTVPAMEQRSSTMSNGGGGGGNGTDVDDDDVSPTKRRREDKAGGAAAAPSAPMPKTERAVWLWKKFLNLQDDDPGAWQRYNEQDCDHIEKCHKKNAKSCKVGSTTEYRISFEGMFQYNTTDTSKQRPVRRIVE